MKKLSILLLMSISLIGCVSSYTPPQTHNVENKKVFNMDFDEVWTKVVAWFGTRGTPIKNIDKNSGFISTEANLQPSSYRYMDCGSGGTMSDYRVTINILAEKANNGVSLTVNMFFSTHLRYMGWSEGADRRIDCSSTGEYEKEFFEFIGE